MYKTNAMLTEELKKAYAEIKVCKEDIREFKAVKREMETTIEKAKNGNYIQLEMLVKESNETITGLRTKIVNIKQDHENSKSFVDQENIEMKARVRVAKQVLDDVLNDRQY